MPTISHNRLKNIRKMLADYFAANIDAEMGELWETNRWDDQTIESWKSERMRQEQPAASR